MRRFDRAASRLPRWLVAIAGIACVVLGLALLTRPLSSLSALTLLICAGLVLSGVTDLLGASSDAAPRPARAVALVSIAGGIVLLLWPALTIRLIALVVAGVLVLAGATRCLSALRAGTIDARITAGLGGAASMLLGLVAFAWPDVTLLVVAVCFGARMVWFGLIYVGAGLGLISLNPESSVTPHAASPRRLVGLVASVFALIVALALAAVSAVLQAGSPTLDDFYLAAGPLPGQPGALLSEEPFVREVPTNARAWRILYTTSRGDGSSALASALVVAPLGNTSLPAPVIAWAHGTTGIAQTCAPSLARQPFESGALFVLNQVLAEGWVLVATDYIGLGTNGPHPYLIGPDEAHSVLDAVRAARSVPGLALDNHVVVWGHSQGGHAALWTGAEAAAYAADLNVVGVAALAPASDLPMLARNFTTVTGGSVFAGYIVSAYSDAYADVTLSTYIRPTAQILVRQMADRCLGEPEVFVSVLTALSLSRDPDIFAIDPGAGALEQRLAENTPTGHIAAPLLIAQGLNDPLVLPDVQSHYAQSRCGAGQPLEYRTYAGSGHVGLVAADSPLVPDLIAWTRARFMAEPWTGGCAVL